MSLLSCLSLSVMGVIGRINSRTLAYPSVFGSFSLSFSPVIGVAGRINSRSLAYPLVFGSFRLSFSLVVSVAGRINSRTLGYPLDSLSTSFGVQLYFTAQKLATLQFFLRHIFSVFSDRIPIYLAVEGL